MIISKIEFENFRNFRDHGVIKCSTDGRITIIYGMNGDGKTTLHQLTQWVFYGKVHFNRTTTDRLYNLSFESEQAYGSTFDVMGRIDFEHGGEQYSLTRVNTYKKGLDDSERILEDLSLSKMDSDHNWKRLENPRDIIEMLLPSGLSEYFFFDGESMIADLRVKGRDSASKLRKALYSMFDLDILESAINHIGRTDLKTSVLGKLYLSKGTVSGNSNISATRANIQNAQNKIAQLQVQLEEAENTKATKQEQIIVISEKIGSSKSKASYEKERKSLRQQRDTFIHSAEMYEAQFGEVIVSTVPQLFVSKAVEDAKSRIHLKISENRLPSGVTKKLINHLLSDSTTTCICGNLLCQDERDHIRDFLAMLPPKSYTSLYNDFSRTARMWGQGYDRELLENFIIDTFKSEQEAQQCDKRIRELDEEQKKAPDIEDLVVDRQNAENTIKDLDKTISELSTQIKKYEIYLKRQMQEFDALTKTSEANQIVSDKIAIMEQVLADFASRLDAASTSYSKLLEESIQELLNRMLTSKRKVSVSPEFAVRVTDSYNDESKSEGQFAVVSFAYIGGILKMLRSEDSLSVKEYPLVLDGPFSKLDPDQRQNVIDTIPQFAPQVILFSKDDLHSLISPQNLGRVWTIVSNDEKNIARVEEGYLWNYGLIFPEGYNSNHITNNRRGTAYGNPTNDMGTIARQTCSSCDGTWFLLRACGTDG